MYLVSPQLFVTSEHIISERASTSSPPSLWVSGDVTELRGLGLRSIWGVVRCESDEALG